MFWCAGKGNTTDIITSCPQYLEREQVNTITCVVNKRHISGSNASNTVLFFNLYPRNTDFCFARFPPTVCAPTNNNSTVYCFCANQTADAYTYQMNMLIKANDSHVFTGGTINCRLSPLPARPLEVYVSPTCRNIQFGMYDFFNLYLLFRYRYIFLNNITNTIL